MKRVFSWIGFSMAITLLVLNLITPKYILIIAIGLAVIFVASLLLPLFRQAKIVPVSVGAGLLACLLFFCSYNFETLPQMNLDGKSEYCSFYFTNAPNDNGVYDAKIIFVDSPQRPQSFKTRIVYKGDTLKPYITYNGKLSFFRISDNGYQSFGAFSDKVFIYAAAKDIKASDKKINSPMSYILDLRQHIKKTFTYYISGDEGAVSNALLTGDTSLLSPRVKSSFNKAGVSHVVAISGLHLSVITGFLIFVLRKLRLDERLISLLSTIAVLFYMMLADFSGSVVRAGIMMLVLLLGRLLNRRADSFNSLGIALFLICLNPFAVTDVGTILSTVAVLSLVTVYPVIVRAIPRKYNDPLNKTKEEKRNDFLQSLLYSVIMTVCIMVISLPFSYLFFGRIVLVSPLSNIIAVPLGSVCVQLSALVYLVSLLHIRPLTICASNVVRLFDTLLIKSINLVADLGNTGVNLDYRFGLLAAGAIVIIAFGYMLNNKKTMLLSIGLSIALVLGGMASFSIADRDKARVYITSGNAIVATYNNKTIVYGVDTPREYSLVKNYLASNGLSADYLVCNDSFEYPALLSNVIEVNTLICSEINDTILCDIKKNNLEVQNAIRLNLFDDYILDYDMGEISMAVQGVTISTENEDANIFVGKREIKDDCGTIKLKQGPIVYEIRNEAYNVRRINQWQK